MVQDRDMVTMEN